VLSTGVRKGAKQSGVGVPLPAVAGSMSGTRLADEPALVSAVQKGDERAFGVLVQRYLETAFAVAVALLRDPHDAEDAVQNAFIRSLERIDQLQAGSPFGPWFYRVLRSTCLNLRRREALRAHDEIPVSAAGGVDPDRELHKGLTRERVVSALGELPDMQRMAVTLYDLEGYRHQEVAEILGIAVGTSRAHVHHARRSLRRIIGPGFGPEETEGTE
jgi:RNA polymerase sigma-70 factor (ECF subfamily)